jgi:hypothetical protein
MIFSVLPIKCCECLPPLLSQFIICTHPKQLNTDHWKKQKLAAYLDGNASLLNYGLTFFKLNVIQACTISFHHDRICSFRLTSCIKPNKWPDRPSDLLYRSLHSVPRIWLLSSPVSQCIVFTTVRKGVSQIMKLKYSYVTTAPKAIINWESGFESHTQTLSQCSHTASTVMAKKHTDKDKGKAR